MDQTTPKPAPTFASPFFDRFAHDLSNLANTLGIYRDLMEAKHLGDLTPQGASTWKHLSQSTSKLRGLVHKFNIHAAAAASQTPEAAVDLEEVVEAAKEQSRRLIDKRKATIVTKNLPIVRGNRDTLLMAVHELLENGLYYCDREPLRIFISSWGNEQGRVVEFCDHGSGKTLRIRDAHVAFQPFQRWGEEAHPAGSGLGLYIAKEIVEKHGADISWHIDPERGTCFWIIFPNDRVVEAEGGERAL